METLTFQNFVSFFLPATCVCCNKQTASHLFICNECYNQLEFIDKSSLPKYFNACFSNNDYCSSLLSLVVFQKDSPIQKVLHKIKYEKKFRLAYNLGQMFFEKYSDEISKLDLDYIVPVPLFHSKKAERGYNQAYYFAKGIRNKSGVLIKNSLLKRIRFTDTQTQLNRKARRENVNGAFKAAAAKHIKGKNILLVDDVLTTGSTLSECAEVLRTAGSGNIHFGTIAIA